MTRYFAKPGKPRAYWLDNDPLIPALTVPEHIPVETGLVDRRGDPILRAPEPCGFHTPRGKRCK